MPELLTKVYLVTDMLLDCADSPMELYAVT